MKAKYMSYIATISIGLYFLTACSFKDNPKDIKVTGADGKTYSTYQEACRAGDFDAAWSFIDILDNMVSSNLDKYDRYQQEYVSAYINARDYVFNSEVQFLLSLGNDDASDRIVYLLNSLPIKGKRLEEGHEGDDARTSIVDGSLFDKNFAWFCESVNSFNNKCRQIMELCITQKNKYLAEKIIRLVKETPTSSESYAFRYVVHYTNDDINAVKKMFDEAVKSGAFN